MEREDLTFPSGDGHCAAWLYRPASGGDAVPCVVMAHGFSLTRHDGLADYAERLAEAGVAVLVPAGASAGAKAAGFPPERVVPDTLLLDVTAEDFPVAATAVGVIRGARIVRTADVRGARRVCDVLAAVLEAP